MAILLGIMQSVFALLTMVFLLVLIRWLSSYFKMKMYTKKLKGPTCLPLLGNALDAHTSHSLLMSSYRYLKTHGSPTKIMVFDDYRILIGDAKSVEFFLCNKKLVSKPHEYGFFEHWIGESLVSCLSGDRWRELRKIISPSFHLEVLQSFLQIMERAGDNLLINLEKEEGHAFDITPYISMCTFDIVCESSLGTPIHAQINSNCAYFNNVKIVCKVMFNRVFSILKRNNFVFSLSEDYKKQTKALKYIHDFTTKLIDDKRAKWNNNNLDDYDDVYKKKRTSFIDNMLKQMVDGKPLSTDFIRKEADTIILGGHDTSTMGISFVLFCLAKNQKAQLQILEELESVTEGNLDKTLTYNDLQNLKYLERVIKESLRLYPSIPIIGRTLEEETEFDGNVYPKGLAVFFCIYALHRNPDYYPDPEKWDPDRFLPENIDKRPVGSYIPFAAGPRNCVGFRYGMMSMKLLITKILKKFVILPTVPEHVPILACEVTIKSYNGVKLILKKRNL